MLLEVSSMKPSRYWIQTPSDLPPAWPLVTLPPYRLCLWLFPTLTSVASNQISRLNALLLSLLIVPTEWITDHEWDWAYRAGPHSIHTIFYIYEYQKKGHTLCFKRSLSAKNVCVMVWLLIVPYSLNMPIVDCGAWLWLVTSCKFVRNALWILICGTINYLNWKSFSTILLL